MRAAVAALAAREVVLGRIARDDDPRAAIARESDLQRSTVSAIIDALEADPRALERTAERLFLIGDLKRKYGETVAYRVGKKFHYDGATGKATDCPEANELMGRKYREGWALNG